MARNITTLYVFHHGCDALDSEAEDLQHSLSGRYRLKIAPRHAAEIVVFLGCTFTQQKEDELNATIDDLLASAQMRLLVISGCYLRAHGDDARVAFARRDEVPSVIDDYLAAQGCVIDDDGSSGVTKGPLITVSEGCYGHCTFCSIRAVRGLHRSRPQRDILLDVETAGENYATVRLVGQEVAAYGRDCGSSLGQLLGEVFNRFPSIKVEIGSLHPRWLIAAEERDLAMLAHPNVAGNVHVPVESASDEVLRRMKRSYSYCEYEDLWLKLRTLGIKRISTDIIAGFPGERSVDHEANLRFLRGHDLTFAQVFMYQPRPGTPAAQMPQLSAEIRLHRAMDLIAEYVRARLPRVPLSGESADTVGAFPLNTNVQIVAPSESSQSGWVLSSILQSRAALDRDSADALALRLSRVQRIRSICENEDPTRLRETVKEKMVKLTIAGR